MHIKNLKIKKLFGRFNYDFSFERNEKNENLFIFHGYNGMGKTHILKILEELCKKNVYAKFSCDEIYLTYSDNSILHIVTDYNNEKEDSKAVYILDGKTTELPRLDEKDNFSRVTRRLAMEIENILPHFTRISPSTWFNIETKERYNIYQIISEYKNNFSSDFLPEIRDFLQPPSDLYNTLPDISTKFIDTKRLEIITNGNVRRSEREHYSERSFQETSALMRLSKIIIEQLNNSLKEYSTRSQLLDRSVLNEILNIVETKDEIYDIVLIKAKVDDLQEKAENFYKVGILDKQKELHIKEGSIKEELLPFLKIYCDNTEEKLSIFNDIYQKITLLTDIINKRFRYKKIKMTKEGLVVQDSDNGKSIPLDALSSGEQHELYLFGSLIFAEKQPDIIFIDEPEISLHVEWQRSFIDDLLEINTGRDTQIMIATHSPQIISDKFDIAFDLPRMNQE